MDFALPMRQAFERIEFDLSSILRILFLGLSLQTYYFYSLGFPVISIASLLLLGICLLWTFANVESSYRVQGARDVFHGYFILLTWSALGMIAYGEGPELKRCVAWLLAMFSCWIGYALLKFVSLEKLLKTFLIIHMVFFIFQFLMFYGFNSVVDFLAPITGEEQRMLGGTFSFPIINRFMRAAGLYNEPGTFVTFIAPIVALFQRFQSKTQINRWVFWVSLSSLFLSFSVFGFLFGAMILFFSVNLKRFQKVIVYSTLLMFLFPILYNRFVVRSSAGHDTGVGIREVYVQRSLEFLWSDPKAVLFGSNLLVTNARVDLGMAHNDIGLLGYLLHFSGLPALMMIVTYFLCKSKQLDGAARIAILIILVSKHSIFAPFFPCLMVLIISKVIRNDAEFKVLET